MLNRAGATANSGHNENHMAIATVYPWLQPAWEGVLARKANLPHALLIHGRAGIGKFDFSRKLAQSLACELPVANGAACGTCLSCRWFLAKSHPDYRELRPEALRVADGEDLAEDLGEIAEEDVPSGKRKRKPSEEIKIEEIRELQDFIHLSTHRTRGKTILVYPAESLNRNAANALLKSLEEPPVSTRFILVSHRPHSLPATIISRCQQIGLPVPQSAVAELWLREQGISEPSLSLAQTGNAPLSALQLDADDYWNQRKTLLGSLAARDVNALALAERIRDYPLARLVGWLQRWSYDLALAKGTAQIRYNIDYHKEIIGTAANLQSLPITRYHRSLNRWQGLVNHPLNARLFIEQLLLSYAALTRGATDFDGYAG